MDDPLHGSSASQASSRERLDSWKEIAAYLHRDVTTVQRWEKREGMPVHRHLHDRMGSVYGFRAELDAWMRSRKTPGTEPSSPAETAPRRRSRRILALLVVGLGVALGVGGYFLIRAARSGAERATSRLIIGVLPLRNLSADPGQDYLVDGLTEEVITELGQLNPQRMGIVRYDPRPAPDRQKPAIVALARASGVRYLLQGSVRREGAQARISLQLTSVADETTVWTESFDRNVGDVLTLQSEIAQRIGREMEIEVLGHPAPKPASAEVVESYLRGRFELARHIDPVPDSVRVRFERAVALDPSYAPAYAGLADYYRSRAISHDAGVADAWRLAGDSAEKALSLDPLDAEAHAALAQIELMHDWDWNAARAHALRALQLNPSLPEAHAVYARYLMVAGNRTGAVSQRKQALALDPLRSDLREQLGRAYLFAGDYRSALALARRALAENPLDASGHYGLCADLGHLNLFDESVVECGEVLALEGHQDWVDPYLREYREHGYDAATRLVARRRLEEIRKLPQPDLWELANAYVAAGMVDDTFRTLQKGLPTHEPGLLQLRVDPDFDSIRADPRYAEIVREIGFPTD